MPSYDKRYLENWNIYIDKYYYVTIWILHWRIDGGKCQFFVPDNTNVFIFFFIEKFRVGWWFSMTCSIIYTTIFCETIWEETKWDSSKFKYFYKNISWHYYELNNNNNNTLGWWHRPPWCTYCYKLSLMNSNIKPLILSRRASRGYAILKYV